MSENEKKANKFTFLAKNFDSINGKTNKDYLIKWGMRGKLNTFMFSFDEYFHLGQKDKFILEFFQDEKVISSVQKLSNNGSWNFLGKKATTVKVEDVDCTLMSVDIFDRFYEKEIVRESGSIKKCFDEYYENILISDELRKALVIEDSDNYDIYSSKERNEFIFRLFKHVAIGGSICQFEDTIQPYIEVTKTIYKDLISVQKDPKTKNIKVVSFVFKVEVFDEKKMKIYPNTSDLEQDFCYMILDPFKRHIILLYHRYEGPLITE